MILDTPHIKKTNEIIVVQPMSEGGLKYRVISKQTGQETHLANIKIMRKNSVIHVHDARFGHEMVITSNFNRSEYIIIDERGIPIAKIKISMSLKPRIRVESETMSFEGEGELLCQEFDFKDDEGNVIITVNKSKVVVDDTFKVRFLESMDPKIPIAIAMCIDDHFYR